MVEVLMGMLLLALATFAVINGLEGAQATGKTNKQRSVAATLAQQDIERLRAYPITSLSNFTQTRTVPVASVNYTVESKTEWIRDSTNALNCTDQTGEADYVKISSTVKSPAQLNPVKEVSLLTPAAGSLSDTNGTLAVKVTDRNGVGRSGVAVTLTGPTNYSKATNSLGCAVFDYIPVATYGVAVPGMVTWAGEGAPDPTATVVGGKTSLKAVEVEPPASLRALLEKPDGTARHVELDPGRERQAPGWREELHGGHRDHLHRRHRPVPLPGRLRRVRRHLPAQQPGLPPAGLLPDLRQGLRDPQPR